MTSERPRNKISLIPDEIERMKCSPFPLSVRFVFRLERLFLCCGCCCCCCCCSCCCSGVPDGGAAGDHDGEGCCCVILLSLSLPPGRCWSCRPPQRAWSPSASTAKPQTSGAKASSTCSAPGQAAGQASALEKATPSRPRPRPPPRTRPARQLRPTPRPTPSPPLLRNAPAAAAAGFLRLPRRGSPAAAVARPRACE